MERVIDWRGALGALGLVLGLAACTESNSPAPSSASQPGVVAAERTLDLRTQVSELEAELARVRARAAEAESTVDRQREELALQEAQRVERERQWSEYSLLLSRVSPDRLPGGKTFVDVTPETSAVVTDPAAPAPPAIDPALERRSLEISRSLSTLLRLEQVRSMDLLECGKLDGSGIGPVVFRLLDGQGRLCGGLYAERLSMEGSRSARTLTLVLERGYETRGGERLPFGVSNSDPARSSARRIVLEPVNPLLWADDFSELFGEHGLDLSGDDGLWDLAWVRQRLNELLKLQGGETSYRLRELAGVQDGTLIGVHLEHLDESGSVERRLFADRMRISRAAVGVEILLENGVQVRGEDQRVAFLDGRYRILLPTAEVEAWVQSALPGLGSPAAKPAQAKPAADGAH